MPIKYSSTGEEYKNVQGYDKNQKTLTISTKSAKSDKSEASNLTVNDIMLGIFPRAHA